MNKLEQLRIEIDNIDTQTIELFEKRMDVIIEVIKYKIENNIPITDNNREMQMLEKNLKKIKNEKYRKYYKSILEGFLTASKEMQKDILSKK